MVPGHVTIEGKRSIMVGAGGHRDTATPGVEYQLNGDTWPDACPKKKEKRPALVSQPADPPFQR